MVLGARAPVDRLAVDARATLAVDVEPLGLGRRRRRSAVGIALAFAATLGHLSTAWRERCSYGRSGSSSTRPGRSARSQSGWASCPSSPASSALARPKGEERDPRTRAFVVTSVARARRLRRLRRGEGRVHLDRLRDAGRRAEPHLSLPRPLRSDGTGVRARDRTRLGDRRSGRLHAERRRGDAAPSGQLPVLRGARALDRRAREPQVRVAGEHDRGCADRRLRRRAPRRRRTQGHASALARLHGRGARAPPSSSSHGRSRGRSTQPPASGTSPSSSSRTSRSRTTGCEQATGGESVVVIGQQIPTTPNSLWLTEFFNPSIEKIWSLDGSAVNVGGPILTPDLDAVDGTLTPPPGHEVRARRQRRDAAGADRREAQGRDPLPGRREAAEAAGRARRTADGRLDGGLDRRPGCARLLHALRRLQGRAGPGRSCS